MHQQLEKICAEIVVIRHSFRNSFQSDDGKPCLFSIHQNVLWSFLISIGLIHWNEKVRGKQLWKRVLVVIATFCLAYIGGIVTFVDYYNAGIFMVLTFYFFRGKKWWNYLGQLVCMWHINFEMLGGFGYEMDLFGKVRFIARQGLALFALIPIWLYNGKQGYCSKKLQCLYYAFYPTHMLILGMIKFS